MHLSSKQVIALQADNERIKLPLFLLILFAGAWLGATPGLIASYLEGDAPTWLPILDLIGFIVPIPLITLVVTGLNHGRTGVKSLLKRVIQWRVHWLWYLIVLLGPAVLFLVTMLISNGLGWTAVSLNPATIFPRFLPAFLVVLILNTEEIAWRGYVLPRLQANLSPAAASLYLGIIWGLFHLPLFLPKGGHPGGYGFGLLLILAPLLSVVFTWVFNNSGGSVLLVHLLHQSFNGWGEAFQVFPIFHGSQWPYWTAILLFLFIALWLIISGRVSTASDPKALIS